ncbi:dienelactone hydrolase family protein [Sphingomonas jatrophae]|uniref:Dienelactone hydrolase n=1 Tax=Sphingomonas jatrophae TaxID=1166337 RepID=A0A1I6JII6_9SPHN|nr:dienelactone hydrolase family protein [Sphingomonas jatrophae]SFR78704.1 Dienelactone hydrolase [Sphingomonas jatrophae]
MTAFTYSDGDLPLIGERWEPVGPANGRAMLVAHEADGIGGNVRRHAALLAEQGYAVFAADLHGHGRVLAGDDMMAAVQRFRADPALFRRRVRAGLDAMLAETGLPPARAAAMGYCFGGSAVLELARSGAELAAVASFHGLLTTAAPAQAGEVHTKILACTGALDPLVPPEDVTAFQQEMMAAGADWQLIVYGRALHSFTNVDVEQLGDPRMAYDAAAEAQSWSALLGFLDTAFASGEA